MRYLIRYERYEEALKCMNLALKGKKKNMALKFVKGTLRPS